MPLPDHVVYLDLETCGFSGSMIFLIGLIHRRDDQFAALPAAGPQLR